ncbi:MAG: hypothetical protein CVV45_01035 [Spirochaetae bacterium HGW-Spirochaetae-10]|nr:MAG: hypothetical protein CVV45_01035 [Spirochaetae bacterium HGW-Spirochaetae-10]
MRTIRKKKNVLAAPEIIRMLPELKAAQPDRHENRAADLLRTGSLFEMPVRSPFLVGRRFRFLPRIIRQMVRFIYGLLVFLHEKFDANRKAAYFLLLEQIWMERTGQSGEKRAR